MSQDCLIYFPVNVSMGVLHTNLQNNLDLLVRGGVKCKFYLLPEISPTRRSNWKPSSQLSPAQQCPKMETLPTQALLFFSPISQSLLFFYSILFWWLWGWLIRSFLQGRRCYLRHTQNKQVCLSERNKVQEHCPRPIRNYLYILLIPLFLATNYLQTAKPRAPVSAPILLSAAFSTLHFSLPETVLFLVLLIAD